MDKDRIVMFGVPCFGFELEVIADDLIDLLHAAIALRIDLRRAAGDDDFCIWIIAAGFADRLPSLAFGFFGHGAGVEDNGVI